MKIEVMVDKDNTHFNYAFDCDKVIDGTGMHGTGSLDDGRKLVIMKKIPKTKEQSLEDYEKLGRCETIAVFNNWTFWRIIDDDAKKCFRCGRFEKIAKNGLCQVCIDKLPDGAK